MAKEILFYTTIYSYSAADIITQLDEVKGQDLIVRINANGGDVEYGFGIIAKLKERPQGFTVKIDGKAHSMYAFLLCYSKDNEALDVSSIILHRAAYSAWFEADPELFTDFHVQELKRINGYLRAALEAKIDVKKFEKLKGVTLDQLFSLDSRIDVQLTAQQAQAIGLVNKIVELTPDKKSEIAAQEQRLAAVFNPAITPAAQQPTPPSTPTNKHTAMTIEQLRAEQPALYAQVLESGVKAGISQERTRVTAFMTFMTIDAKAVQEDITAGKEMDIAVMTAYQVKLTAAAHLTALGSGTPGPIQTPQAPQAKTPEQLAVEAEWAVFDKNLKITQ